MAIDVNKMENDFMGMDDEEEDLSLMDGEIGKEVDLLKDGGIIKKILAKGEGWEQPQKGDKVTVHYTGTLQDGTKFDSSVDRGEPFEFKLGQGSVIKGWDKGVATMKKGEKSVFTLRSDYAYGEAGSPPKIPGGATLVFEIELISWVSINDLSPEKDGSILKTIIKEADIGVWDRPQSPDIATIKFSAKVESAEAPFVADEEAEFKVDDGFFCPAVKITVRDMKLGEKVKVKVAPKYGFGEAGRDGVPPNAALEMEIELLHVKVVKFVDPNKTGTVVKMILTQGKNYQTPNDGAKVTVTWTGRLQDGTEFDKVENAEYTLDSDHFPCEGLELSVASMKANEVAEVTIHDAELAFGATGIPGKVPPSAVVTYHVELHEFTNGPNVWEMSAGEKLGVAEKRKAQGNAAFKAGRWDRAKRMYSKAEETLTMDNKNMADKERQKVKEIQVSCSLNLAAVALKLKDYRAAITSATKVLDKSPGHVKALFRRSQAFMETGDVVEADADLKAALLLDPTSKELLTAKKELRRRMKEVDQSASKLYGKMFAKVGQLYEVPPIASHKLAEDEDGADNPTPMPTEA